MAEVSAAMARLRSMRDRMTEVSTAMARQRSMREKTLLTHAGMYCLTFAFVVMVAAIILSSVSGRGFSMTNKGMSGMAPTYLRPDGVPFAHSWGSFSLFELLALAEKAIGSGNYCLSRRVAALSYLTVAFMLTVVAILVIGQELYSIALATMGKEKQTATLMTSIMDGVERFCDTSREHDPLKALAKNLATADSAVQKQMIGAKLYPLVCSMVPKLSGKIMGSLLQLEQGELLHMLESDDLLYEKTSEALVCFSSRGDSDATELVEIFHPPLVVTATPSSIKRTSVTISFTAMSGKELAVLDFVPCSKVGIARTHLARHLGKLACQVKLIGPDGQVFTDECSLAALCK